MQAVNFQALIEDEGARLDQFIAKSCDISRALSQQLIEQGNVIVNQKSEILLFIILFSFYLSIIINSNSKYFDLEPFINMKKHFL